MLDVGQDFEVSFLLELSCQRWVFEEILQIYTMVSLYSVFFVDNDKTKCISNLFSWSNYNDCYAFIQECVTKRVPLFKHVSTIEVSWVW